MAELAFFHYFCFLITLLAALLGRIDSRQPENHRPAMFVFGDSLYDSGNNQHWNGSRPNQMGHLPYGETYFKRPSGRASDGRIVPDFISLFAGLPFLPPYLKPGDHDFGYGTNIASAGAGVLVETHPKISINLHLQLSYFRNVKQWLDQKLGKAEATKLLNRAVYLFSAGNNDYFVFWQLNPNATASAQREFVRMVIGNLTNALREIYALGGRKMAFQNIGPLGCTPAAKAMGGSHGNCMETLQALARRHNRMLSRSLQKLQTQLPGFKYSIFDFYNALSDRINNPSKYGFKEARESCCGTGPFRASYCGLMNATANYELCPNPREYIFFDGAHPTEATNWQMAKLFWSGSAKVTGPYNLKQLFKIP